jgi:hypothetical protein
MPYYKRYPVIDWSPCMFCRFPDESIDNLASPIEASDNANIENPLFPEKMKLEEAIIHP